MDMASVSLFLSFSLIWMDTDELIKKNEEFDYKLITFFYFVRETVWLDENTRTICIWSWRILETYLRGQDHMHASTEDKISLFSWLN